MNRIKKLWTVCFCSFLIGITFVYGQTEKALSQGEKLFKENKAKEAVQVLENELLNGIVSANTYNFLGLGYYQLKEYAKSIDAFKRGIEAQPANIKLLSFNQGNTYYAMKDYASAISCYSTSLKDTPDFYDALLNRANALLMSDQLGNAKADYIDYIEKCPEDRQKSQIEKIIKAITDEMERRAEEERLLAEQNKAKWEEVDPSFDEAAGEETQWEKVDARITESEEEKKPDWENVDARINEQVTEEKKTSWENVDAKISEQTEEKKTDWENVDASIKNQERPKKTTPWEMVENSGSQIENNKKSAAEEKLKNNKIKDDGSEAKKNWEYIETEKYTKSDSEKLDVYKDDMDLTASWENLTEEETLEMKRLERESRLEYEKWLEEQSLLRQREAEEELRKLQMKDDQERLSREKLLEDMMRAEEARRKKLLDDVANSLQNGDSTNMSSGADELIEYDQEGELD